MLKLVNKLTTEEIAQLAILQPARPSLQWRENFAYGVRVWRKEYHCLAIIGRASRDWNVGYPGQ
jgi:hypothetical protein